MSEASTVHFFDIFESKYPGLKRAKNKPYALMALKPESEIALVVKKDYVKVEFSSPGREKSLSKEALKSWVEDKGILTAQIAGQCFELAAGAKNKDKLFVAINIPLKADDQLADEALQADVKAALDLIWNNLDGLVEVPEEKPSIKSASAPAQKGPLSVKAVEAEIDDDNEFSGTVTLASDGLGEEGDVLFVKGELNVTAGDAEEERSEVSEYVVIGDHDLGFDTGFH